MTTPLLSFIVLSYNYENYISETIRSILAQTVQDFEIVVVDDASSDRSCEVVRGFNDPRIRLIVNEKNLGGAGSYNVAVQAARGEWLVNLDADDWIAPEKSVRQLKVAAQNPHLDIIGTWVNLVGADGRPHPDRSTVELAWNRDYALNRVDTWIGTNHLCRSSTMVRRSTHLKIGLDDPDMVAAPDYELWTRALAHGCRFHIVKENLTFSRLHPRGVTRANLLRTLLEISFALQKNIVPIIEQRALWPSFTKILRWVGSSPELTGLSSRERERLFGLLMSNAAIPTFAGFRDALSQPDLELEAVGRRALFAFAQTEFEIQQNIGLHLAAIEGLRGEIRQLTQTHDQLKTRNEVLEHEIRGNTRVSARHESIPVQEGIQEPVSGHHVPHSLQGKHDPVRRVKRWIAPGKGRWVRIKGRLSQLEQRFLRWFAQ